MQPTDQQGLNNLPGQAAHESSRLHSTPPQCASVRGTYAARKPQENLVDLRDDDLLVQGCSGIGLEDLFDRRIGRLRDLAGEPLYQQCTARAKQKEEA